MNQLPDLLLSEKNRIPCVGKVAQVTKYSVIIAYNSKYLIMGQAVVNRQKEELDRQKAEVNRQKEEFCQLIGLLILIFLHGIILKIKGIILLLLVSGIMLRIRRMAD